MEKFPGTLQRAGISGKIILTPEQKEWLERWFPIIENPRLMRESGLCHSTLHRLARELHLTKSEKGMKAIKKRQAAQIKKTCEANGWYDSMRGHTPSEACIEGYKKYLKSDRYKHPLVRMREKNPRKYRQYIQQSSAAHKERWRKEQRRLVLGMEKKYKFKVVFKAFTRSQACHRNNCLKYGYFLSADHSEQGGERYIIFYDDNTRRSEKFEKNCIADGFTFRYEPS